MIQFDGIFRDQKLYFNPALYKRWRNFFKLIFQTARIQVTGLENIPEKGQALLAANHLGWKDIPFIASVIERPVSFVATSRLFNTDSCQQMLNEYFLLILSDPLSRKAIGRTTTFLAKFLVKRVSQCGAIPAKLKTSNYSFASAATNSFEKGRLVCFFPEGRPGNPQQLGRFRGGIIKVVWDYYRKFGKSIPVFPVGISGTEKSFYPGLRLSFHAGPPIFIEEFHNTPSQFFNYFHYKLEDEVKKLVEYPTN